MAPLRSPSPLDSVRYLPSKVVFTNDDSVIVSYQITYDNSDQVKTIKEQLFSSDESQTGDFTMYDFTYQNKQLINYFWQSDTKETITYGFEYDEKGLLIQLLKNGKSRCQEIGPTNEFTSRVVLKNDHSFEQDTIKIAVDDNLIKVYSNQFYLYSYKKTNQQLTLIQRDIEKEKMLFSNKRNQLSLPLNLLLSAFLNDEITETSDFQSPLIPVPYFFFDPIAQLSLGNFPVQINGNNFIYEIDNFDRIKAVKLVSNSSIKQMQFYY